VTGTKYIFHSINDTIFTKKLLNKQGFKLTPGFYTKSNPRKGFTPVLGDWIKGLGLNWRWENPFESIRQAESIHTAES